MSEPLVSVRPSGPPSAPAAQPTRPEGSGVGSEPRVADKLSISQPAPEHENSFAVERDALSWARGLVDAGRVGVSQASALVERAAGLWQHGQPDPAHLAALGGEMLRVAELTSFRGLYPLREPGQLQFPHLAAQTWRLFGSEPDALVGLDGFIGGGDQTVALGALTASQARLVAADQLLANQRGELDRRHLDLAASEWEALSAEEPPEVVEVDQSTFSSIHRAPEHERVVELLMLDGRSSPV